jgi:hypothetical protein
MGDSNIATNGRTDEFSTQSGITRPRGRQNERLLRGDIGGLEKAQ